MTKPTTAMPRRNPVLGIKNSAVGGGTVSFKPRALAPDVRSVYCLMSPQQLRTIARVASSTDIPMHVPMGQRTILHGDSDRSLQSEGLCEVAALCELGRREELLSAVLSDVAYMCSYRPGRDTAKDIATNISTGHDTKGILAVLRVFEKRQHAALPQEPVTALQLNLAKGLEHATEKVPFASLCGLIATTSRSRRRQRAASVDPSAVLPWDRMLCAPGMLCDPGFQWEPTETEMTEAHEWVSARVATSTPAHAAAKRDEEPASVETWLLEIAKLPSHKAAYLAAILAAEGLCTVGDLRTVAGQSTVTSFGTLRRELENLCTELREHTDQALNAKDYMALYSCLTPLPPKELSTACH